MSVSGMNVNASRPLLAAEKIKPPEIQRPREEPEKRPIKPAQDEYVPEEKREPYGRYWPGKDGDGQPKIYFEAPERPDKPDSVPGEDDQTQKPKGPEKKDEKEEVCIGSTDKVDREIKRLKREKAELEQKINAETDRTKTEALEKKLAQVERELKQKDNDAYRRQHSEFTRMS